SPVQITHVSSVYETAALLPEGAPSEWDISYYNMVLSCDSYLEPEVLLGALKVIETDMGRKDVGRWGPRVIDIDILAYQDAIRDSRDLALPHPEMHNRDFVMVPLAEIAPDWVHPILKQTAQEIVAARGYATGEHLKRV
ncbi:MAG: 2-amino-4-hydroxy-6-hydroxymethyldihydropteridine diphosphokinase, partial [Rickettsiales bacterium]